MFALRGIAVSLSLAILLYVSLSFLAASTWKFFYRTAKSSRIQSADFLFALRFAPLVLTLAITVVFAIPSFLLLEPRHTSEPLGPLPIVLTGVAAAFAASGIRKATLALTRTSSAVARWGLGASSMVREASSSLNDHSYVGGFNAAAPAIFRSSTAPPLMVAGVFKSSIWLSRAAECILTEAELQSALRHERIHIQRKDNFRKLLFRMAAFPGMKPLENAWREAAETAADDAAVSNAQEALDLAAAIVKLSRLTSSHAPLELTTALVSTHSDSVAMRVSRLLTWSERHPQPRNRDLWLYAWSAFAAMIIAIAASYGHLLLAIHAASEWLVR